MAVHIGKNGPAPCPAKIQCRLLGPDGNPAQHFNTFAEASKVYDEMMIKINGTTGSPSENQEAKKIEIANILDDRNIKVEIDGDKFIVSDKYDKLFEVDENGVSNVNSNAAGAITNANKVRKMLKSKPKEKICKGCNLADSEINEMGYCPDCFTG